MLAGALEFGDELGEALLEHVVAQIHHEVVVTKEVLGDENTVGKTKRGVLRDVRHLDPELRAVAHRGADLFARLADDDADFFDPRQRHGLDAIEQDRLVGDGDQLFGARMGDRPEAGAGPAREDQALHTASRLLIPTGAKACQLASESMTGPFLHAFSKPSKSGFVNLVRGSGALLWDKDGKEYVDGIASLWYCTVGHGRKEIADAVAAQISQLESYSTFDPFTNDTTEKLAAKLQSISALPNARIFMCGSGSESVDSAMKLARVAHVQNGHPERTIIISRDRGYHGTNYGGTSAQGLPLNKQGFGPLVPEVVQVNGDNIEDLANFMRDNGDRVAAVLMEPLQGAGGVYPPTPGYLESARKLCDQHGAFLIFDEVISGYARMGTWFASHFYGVVPDMLCFAKGVTSGYQPLGGVFVGRRVCDALERDPNFILRHGYTYSGHATVCAAALKNLEIIERESLIERAKHVGARIRDGLTALAKDGLIKEVRGDGAVWAAGLHEQQNCITIRDRMIELGVIVRAINADTNAFCPPLVITDSEIDRMIDAFAQAAAGK